jgi:hypothetical protein
MKKFSIILILLFVTILSYSQNIMEYSKVIQAEGISAVDLYSITKSWISLKFVRPKKVIQVEDPTKNYISCNASSIYSYGTLQALAYDGEVHYTIVIQSRDGRVRVEMTNLIHENLTTNNRNCNLGLLYNIDNQFTKGVYKSFNNKVAKDIKYKMLLLFDEICDSLEDFVKNPESSHNEDW